MISHNVPRPGVLLDVHELQPPFHLNKAVPVRAPVIMWIVLQSLARLYCAAACEYRSAAVSLRPSIGLNIALNPFSASKASAWSFSA